MDSTSTAQKHLVHHQEGKSAGRKTPAVLDDPPSLAAAVQSGSVRAISRLISLAEQEDDRASATLRLLRPRGDGAHLVGITGVPGSGKSTLVDQLIDVARAAGLTVAVLAVDPSSPFTGGSVLGDRLRMQRHSGDDGTFIRSLSSRGDMGGLSAAVWDAASVLGASGWDVIFIETVGAGQLETEIVSSAHTVVVVAAPGLGDSVQAMKAGLFEAADIFVVNMADRPQAAQTARRLDELRLQSRDSPAWKVPVLTTVATNGEGVEALWETVRRHRAHLQDSGALGRRLRDRARAELARRLERRWHRHLQERLRQDGSITRLAEQVASGDLPVQDAADLMWERVSLARVEARTD